MKYIMFVLFLFLTIALSAQQKYYVPDLLGPYPKVIKCFTDDGHPISFLKENYAYCIEYVVNADNEQVPVRKIEKVGDRWQVTELSSSEVVIYRENKEVIEDLDEIQTMTKDMQPVTHKIYYYRTEKE